MIRKFDTKSIPSIISFSFLSVKSVKSSDNSVDMVIFSPGSKSCAPFWSHPQTQRNKQEMRKERREKGERGERKKGLQSA
jgi:hypothetical protein